jgi:cell division protein FtsL
VSPAPATARSRTSTQAGSRRLAPVRPPRRVSGPSPGRRPLPAAPRPTLPRPLAALARAIARAARHPLVDRIITGRWSIAVIAFALIGIVTLQLGLLKLNVGIGRSLEKQRTLERENATLGIENAELASPERIRQLAARLGMSPVALSELRFLRAPHDPAAPARAAARLHAAVHAGGEAEAHSSTDASGEAHGSETTATETAATETTSAGATGTEAAPTEAVDSEAPDSEASGPAPTGTASPTTEAASTTAQTASPDGEPGQGG